MTIIYHETFLSESDEGIFENQLSLEMRFSLTPDGTILDCNRNGEVMVNRYGRSFLNFFTGQVVHDAENYLHDILCSEQLVTVVLHDQMDLSGTGILFNGLFKKGKIYLTGYDTQLTTKLAAEFVHELRNPLTVIRGFVQLSSITQEFDKYHGSILSEIDRMYSILENFLSSSTDKMKMESILPDKLAAELIAFISPECLLKEVNFDYDIVCSSNPCRVNIDKMKQVLLNLMRNALEALEEKKDKDRRIFLRGSVDDQGYCFSLSDNGVGIETSVLKRLGQPFYTTKTNGNGIGLSLCKKIIADHDGTFCLSSVPGKGTTVSFTLPFEAH